MINKTFDIRGILLDYGGTVDTDGVHWSEVLWAAYCTIGVSVDKSAFREAYRHGERTLAFQPVIRPQYNFYDVLIAKTEIQLRYLAENGYLPATFDIPENGKLISRLCYEQVRRTVKKSATVLERLSQFCPVALVSNFYGNLRSVLADLNIGQYFTDVIESAVVGVRKPDPAIFVLGVRSLGFDAAHVVAVGDSYTKDMIPARKAGCRTVWLKGKDWEETADTGKADVVIEHFEELLNHIVIS
jgi:putative hydrolase of the HAD superfamily